MTLTKAPDKGMPALAAATPRMADPAAYEARRAYRRARAAKAPTSKPATGKKRTNARAQYLVGKQVKQYSGPVDVTDTIRDAIDAAAPVYEAMHANAADPHTLTKSNYTAAALSYALAHVNDWLVQVPNNGRREHFRAVAEAKAAGIEFEAPKRGYLDVVWPDEVVASVEDAVAKHAQAYKDLRETPGGVEFDLTAAPLVLTALTWAITRQDEWLNEVPNDPRHAPLSDSDKRLNPAAWNRGQGPTPRGATD